MFQSKSIDRQSIQERFRQYRNHPYAVHAALDLLLSPSFMSVHQLPTEPIPAVVCPLQWKGIVEHLMHVLGRSGLRVVSLLPCFRGGVWGVKYCWNQCSSNFSSPNKFESLLPCDLLVDNNWLHTLQTDDK
jgi:hypothetical protein